MGTYVVFQCARAMLSPQFMSLIPSDVDQTVLLSEVTTELNLTTDLTSDASYPALQGQWEDILQAQVKLTKLMHEWQKVKGNNERHQSSVANNNNSNHNLNHLSRCNIVSNSEEDCSVVEKNNFNKNESSDAAVSKYYEKINPIPEYAKEEREELYMNIVLASKKDFNSSVADVELKENENVKSINKENPLDKLCQLLRIDEEVSISEISDKKCDVFERRQRYENNMPFKYFCTHCSFKSKRENQFLKHQKLHEKHKDLYHCRRCQFTTIRVANLRRHELQHNVTHLKTCPKCPYKTDSLKFLKRHIQTRHSFNNPALQCCHCDFTASTLRELKKHRLVHNSVKPKIFWNCNLCSYKTQNKGHLKRHKNDVHELIRSYLCHHCGKSFKRHDTLNQHKMTHGETGRTYSCSQCNKLCRSTSQLKEHMSVHTTQRPFLCELCGATFKTRSNQSKHIKMMHATVKLVPCQLCKRVFSNKATMIRHKKMHHRTKENSRSVEVGSSNSKTFSITSPQPSSENLKNKTIDCNNQE